MYFWRPLQPKTHFWLRDLLQVYRWLIMYLLIFFTWNSVVTCFHFRPHEDNITCTMALVCLVCVYVCAYHFLPVDKLDNSALSLWPSPLTRWPALFYFSFVLLFVSRRSSGRRMDGWRLSEAELMRTSKHQRQSCLTPFIPTSRGSAAVCVWSRLLRR